MTNTNPQKTTFSHPKPTCMAWTRSEVSKKSKILIKTSEGRSLIVVPITPPSISPSSAFPFSSFSSFFSFSFFSFSSFSPFSPFSFFSFFPPFSPPFSSLFLFFSFSSFSLRSSLVPTSIIGQWLPLRAIISGINLFFASEKDFLSTREKRTMQV